MSNIVTIVRNSGDTQVEINGHEVCNVVECTHIETDGVKKVALVFEASMVNIIGVNAQRDPAWKPFPTTKLTRWQRFKKWWNERCAAFEAWQNGDYTDY